MLLCAVVGRYGYAGQPDGGERPVPHVVIGSKSFTESVILGHMLAQLARSHGAETWHRSGLGGTRFVWEALLRGDVDMYPEYTGTILEEIFRDRVLQDEAALREALAEQGVRMSRTLGFNNTYAIGMKPQVAQRLGIERISDLREHPDLRLGFSNEFLDRGDGWPALRVRYGLPQTEVRGLDHDLAYRAIDADQFDAIDLYTTDAEIDYYGLQMLEDDLGHFPTYDAVVLYRADLVQRWPEVSGVLGKIEGRISATAMRRMNARAKLDHVPDPQVSADFLADALDIHVQVEIEGLAARLRDRTEEHLFLVGISLSVAVGLAVPLGIIAARRRRFGQVVLGTVGIMQTLPSLALFVFMIPLLGIGPLPVITALILYSMLPIVRNTHAGLTGIPPALLESADALGLPRPARLRLVEMPMALQMILAGIKTSAVINVGTATLGALMAAGGYGESIFTGIRLNRTDLILEGAIPAAVMALAVQGLFELTERLVVSKGLRLKQAE